MHKVCCDGCGKKIKEDSRFYVLTLASCLSNTKIWDYEREEDSEVYCLGCANRLTFDTFDEDERRKAQRKHCRYCMHMKSYGDEGSMRCDLERCKSDVTAVTCRFFKFNFAFRLKRRKIPRGATWKGASPKEKE